MKLVVDVDYHLNHDSGTASVAGVVFDRWQAREPVSAYVTDIAEVKAYKPGKFYQRELPCIIELMKLVVEPIDMVIVDGYVWLDKEGSPGLGAHLFQFYEALGCPTPVVGVAKSSYFGSAHAIHLLRGKGKRPLYITTVGANLEETADQVRGMTGKNRIPKMLKLVDQLCRRTSWITRAGGIVSKGTKPQETMTSTHPRAE